MRSTSLESFLLLFTLKLFVAVGNAYPITDLELEDLSEENNMSKSASISVNDASIESHTCVYVPPDLDLCNFINYPKSSENLWEVERKLSGKRVRKLLKSNKMYLPHSSMNVPGTEKFLKQKPEKTIIYKIQRCMPPRLPFVLPWCTDEDLSDKQNEIRRLYPFVINGSSEATYEFPFYDLPRQILTVSKSA
ncbi:hypothetical protein DMN91_012582 [Ooceraea biroi]|uniref:Uncharacterized protein n=1 Tax=Ooceraea biroi TaxID=2015173 RepID=A0A3L8D6V6_OOCBI|nr:uncharacterized protein LOC105285107 [Ooceraea biroi]RLU15588.1 hypothetical protein DMN91_012582 [Ooceraea biroi]